LAWHCYWESPRTLSPDWLKQKKQKDKHKQKQTEIETETMSKKLLWKLAPHIIFFISNILFLFSCAYKFSWSRERDGAYPSDTYLCAHCTNTKALSIFYYLYLF
jgi:hypothetical protein